MLNCYRGALVKKYVRRVDCSKQRSADLIKIHTLLYKLRDIIGIVRPNVYQSICG